MQSILQSVVTTAALAVALGVVSIVALVQFLQKGTVDQGLAVFWGTLLSLLNAQAHLTTTAKVSSLEAKIDGNGK